MTDEPAFWAIVPAAGIGRRMGASIPKQFLKLGDRSVLEHSLEALCSLQELSGLVLVSDEHPDLIPIVERFSSRGLLRAPGGSERCHSVLNGLQALSACAADHDWVLVHDAARPCVRFGDIRSLLDRLGGDEVGGLLGVPVHDTMKRSDDGARIEATVDRNGLWHAYTPQVFRYAMLKSSLQQALEDGYQVTDEASALEHAGHRPLMVEGHADNLKVTRPEDLSLAEFFLRQQARL